MLQHLSPDFLLHSLYAFLCAGILSCLATPLIRQLAIRWGAVDVPKDNRRMHRNAMPLWGGVAIWLGFTVSVLLFGQLDKEMVGIVIGAGLVMVTGMLDDRFDLPPLVKLVGQIIAAAVPVCLGLRIESFTNLFPWLDGDSIFLSISSIPLTIIWIVGLSNAVNLIDGLDGLACGVSSIASLSIFLIIIQIPGGSLATALLIAALAGACFGFLPFNFNPAKIFMGDSGALFLGYVLGAASITGMFKWYALVSFGLPFLVLGLPIFDTAVAIIRRLLRGQKPWQADRGHLHHRLIDMGLSQRQAVAVLYTASGVLGLSAVLLTESNWIKLIVMGAVICIAVALAIRSFVIHERHLKKHSVQIPCDPEQSACGRAGEDSDQV